MRRSLPLLAAAVAVPLALAMAAPATADTVRLRNGRAYEGVIAEEVAGGVRIRLAFGHLVLPHEQVLAVEKSPSALAEYLLRKKDLSRDPEAGAAEWLGLARWAREQDIPQGVREAALLAAEADPALPGLEPLLRPFGFVHDVEAGRWLPFEESMARRGMVRDDGEWVSLAQQRERQADRERRRAELAREEATRRLAAAAEAIERETLRRALDRQSAVAQPPVVVGFPVLAYPVLTSPVFVVVPPPHTPAPQPQPTPQVAPRHGYGSLLHRAPGSLLPPPDPASFGKVSARGN